MHIFFSGGEPAADRSIARALEAAGHVLQRSPETAEAAVLHWTQGAAGVQAVTTRLPPDAHLLLLSSHAVYPSVRTPVPWRETDHHPADDAGAGATTAAQHARAAERALVLGEGARTRWTILRPSIVEGLDDPTDRSWWLLSRLLDGHPLVLPDDGPNVYRHVHADDLAAAVRLLVGCERAFGQLVNVTGEGLLTPLGHALMMMDGLERRVPVQWVPARMWRSAGLPQPMSEAEQTSLIETSPLLTHLGWSPSPEAPWVAGLARRSSERRAPPPDAAHRALELQVLREAGASDDFDLRPGADAPTTPLPRRWQVMVSPSAPDSVTFHARSTPLPAPVLKVVGVAFDDTVERLLSGDLPARPEPLVPGHAALLELLEPGTAPFAPGARILPLSRTPCADAGCAWCRDGVERFMGVDADGFTASHVTSPPSHLVPVPAGLGEAALLAHPLARLLETFSPLLENLDAPVWILGTSAQAGLAGLLAHDAGKQVVHLDRMPADSLVSPAGHPVQSLFLSWENVRTGVASRPGLCANLSGAREGENLLIDASTPDAKLVTPFGADHPRAVRLAPAARTRVHLEEALLRLERWASFRDLDALVAPRVDPRVALDALLAPAFRLGVVGAAP